METLSDKCFKDVLHTDDVKEFIRKLKEDISNAMFRAGRQYGVRNSINANEIINKLAGDKLT